MIFSWHCNTGFQLIFIWCIAEGKETMSLGNLWPQVYVKASREWEWLNQKWGPLGNLWFLGDNHGCLSCLQWSKPLGFWNKIPNYRQPPQAVLTGKMWALVPPSGELHSQPLSFTLKDVTPEGLPLPCHGLLNPWLGTWPMLYLHLLSPASFNLGSKFWN